MTIALNIEQVVAGYVNTHDTETMFGIDDVKKYIDTLWDAGCGPVRLNFTDADIGWFLEKCVGVCLEKDFAGYRIDKSLLNGELNKMPEDEQKFFHHDSNIAKSFDLIVKLGVDFRTPNRMLDAMGFRFIHAE